MRFERVTEWTVVPVEFWVKPYDVVNPCWIDDEVISLVVKVMVAEVEVMLETVMEEMVGAVLSTTAVLAPGRTKRDEMFSGGFLRATKLRT